VQYAASRGISLDNSIAFGLATVIGDWSRSRADWALTGRLLFPIWHGRKIVFWVARDTTGDSKAKTINMPRPCRTTGHDPGCTCYHEAWGLPPVPHSALGHEVVLGLHLVIPGSTVYVVEGGTDAAVCGPGFVATLGAKCSLQQAALIAASGASEAVVLYDGDEAGRKAAPKVAERLAALMPTRYAICPAGQDPGSLGREASIAVAQSAPKAGQLSPLAPPRKNPTTIPQLQPLQIRNIQKM
jgi:hypothetical protein